MFQKKKSGADSEAGEEEIERRISVRQSESVYKYKDIVVKKCAGYTQIWLATQTTVKNALNPRVSDMCQLVQSLYS